MPSLATDYLAHTRVTAAGVEKFRQAQSGIRVVWAMPDEQNGSNSGVNARTRPNPKVPSQRRDQAKRYETP